jgi:hypothetical protein
VNRNARRRFDAFQLFDIFAVPAKPPRNIRKGVLKKHPVDTQDDIESDPFFALAYFFCERLRSP